MNKSAKTNFPIIEPIYQRWSPRSFSEKAITPEDIGSLFEAARWAASSMNEQPWRFIYANKGEEAHQLIVESLMEGNQGWASKAPVLILTIIDKFLTKSGKPNSAAMHDLGLAVGNMSIQASAMGIGIHQMGGFFPDKAKALFEINDQFDAVTAIAVGYFGEASELDEPLRSREMAARSRKPLNEIALHGNFNK
ncbi:MAG: nitroreductase family protein [Cyclobacteriaceae bacterium]